MTLFSHPITPSTRQVCETTRRFDPQSTTSALCRQTTQPYKTLNKHWPARPDQFRPDRISQGIPSFPFRVRSVLFCCHSGAFRIHFLLDPNKIETHAHRWFPRMCSPTSAKLWTARKQRSHLYVLHSSFVYNFPLFIPIPHPRHLHVSYWTIFSLLYQLQDFCLVLSNLLLVISLSGLYLQSLSKVISILIPALFLHSLLSLSNFLVSLSS